MIKMAVAQNKSLNYSIGNKIGNEGAKILGQALRKHTTMKKLSLECEQTENRNSLWMKTLLEQITR